MENEKLTEEEIENIQQKLLDNVSYEKLASFYSLFADTTRLRIISLLLHNELCVNDIASILNVSQSVVSHQLAVLRKHDIVTYNRKGKSILYSLTDHHIKDLFETGLEHASEKDKQIGSDRAIKGYSK